MNTYENTNLESYVVFLHMVSLLEVCAWVGGHTPLTQCHCPIHSLGVTSLCTCFSIHKGTYYTILHFFLRPCTKALPPAHLSRGLNQRKCGCHIIRLQLKVNPVQAKWASKLAVIFRRSWRNMTRCRLGVYSQARLHLRGAKWGRWERPLKGETRGDNDIIKECLKIIKAQRWSEAPSRFLAPLRWNIHTPAPAGDHHFPLHLCRSVLLLRGGGRFAAATRRRKRQSTQNICAIFSFICCISFSITPPHPFKKETKKKNKDISFQQELEESSTSAERRRGAATPTGHL